MSELQLVIVEATCRCMSDYTVVCVCETTRQSLALTKQGELDYVFQGKGGYLAIKHKHSSSPQPKDFEVCHSGLMKSRLANTNLMKLSRPGIFFLFSYHHSDVAVGHGHKLNR